MKYLRLYEEVKKPQVGDYVAVRDDTDEVNSFRGCKDTMYGRDLFDSFLSNNVGQLIKMERTSFPYLITFDNLSNQSHEVISFFSTDINMEFYRDFERCEILYFDNNRENVELWIQSKRYNL